MTAEAVLASLVEACIAARDHPVREEREESVHDLALSLERIVQERLADTWEWDERYAGLDGLKTLSVEVRGDRTLHIVGAFYVLVTRGGGTDHRMLPVDAELSIEPGVRSTVKVAAIDCLFEIPASHRQFARGVERADWRHLVELSLAG